MSCPVHIIAVLFIMIPGAARACWEDAGRRYAVSPALLYSVAQAESSLNPRAVNRTHFHLTHTLDIGYMGINSDKKVLRNLGLSEADLYDTCKNIHAGARILREKIDRFENTWEAIGAYNASCVRLAPVACQQTRRRYAWRVYGFLNQTQATGQRRKVPRPPRIGGPERGPAIITIVSLA